MRVYLHMTEPEKYPDFTRRAAKAVTRSALDNKIQFTSLRGFPTSSQNLNAIGEAADTGARPLQDEGSRLNDIAETIALYVDHFKLGRVLWPVYMTLFAGNFKELVDICAERGLFLYDFWGYVPGSKPGSEMWGEYSIPVTTDEYMKQKLGDRFLGYDNGEQDGRYVAASARDSVPTIDSVILQYKNFQEYFEKLNDAMQNHTVTLASLTFLHYFAREGNTIMLGAETAQALPSNPMWFAFIRGASKQYGLLNYGNASIWNRWGYRDYAVDSDQPDTSHGYEMGRTGGTSLSQLRRLIYNQYMYNCDILGFEGGWFTTAPAKEGDISDDTHCVVGKTTYTLTPIGEIQRTCVKFVEEHGFPGTLYTPVAIITDSFSGWVPPRHLYTGDIYKSWGNLPYKEGDYQLDCLFTMLFPGYENAGFYRDERGFLTPTPYGEIADVLLSDVRGEVLNRYNIAVLLLDTILNLELLYKLRDFVDAGGRLIVFSETIEYATGYACADNAFSRLFDIGDGDQDVVVNEFGKGSVTILNTVEGLKRTGDSLEYRNSPNSDIPRPYKFERPVERELSHAFASTKIIAVDNPALQFTLAIKDCDSYTLFVSNNTLADESFNIISPVGKIEEITEYTIDDGVTELPEFLPRPEFVTRTAPKKTHGEYKIAAYDCRMFAVRTSGISLETLPESNPQPRDDDLYLSLGYKNLSAKDYLLGHPTFLYHFGGMLLPAEYLDRMSDFAAEREAHYFKLQNVRVIVDFTHMINHVPDLTLIGNFPKRTEASIARIEAILKKAEKYGCTGAIFTLQRNAENSYSPQDAVNGLKASLFKIRAICERLGITAYVSNRNVLIGLNEQLEMFSSGEYGALAYNTSFAMQSGAECSLPDNASLLMLSDMYCDDYGQKYAVNAKIHGSERSDELKSVYRAAKAKKIPVVLCAEYDNWDEAMADVYELR